MSPGQEYPNKAYILIDKRFISPGALGFLSLADDELGFLADGKLERQKAGSQGAKAAAKSQFTTQFSTAIYYHGSAGPGRLFRPGAS